jgi:hypothetical protein
MKVALLHGTSNIFISKLKSDCVLKNLKFETTFLPISYFLEHMHIRHLHFVTFVLLILHSLLTYILNAKCIIIDLGQFLNNITYYSKNFLGSNSNCDCYRSSMNVLLHFFVRILIDFVNNTFGGKALVDSITTTPNNQLQELTI